MGRKFFLMITASLSVIFLLGGLLFENTAHAKNTSIHVHVQGDAELVESLSVIFKGEELALESKSPTLFSVKKPQDIVKPDVSAIIVYKTDGSTVEYSPATEYAGEEGNGTINYWIDVSAEVVEEEEPEEDAAEDEAPSDNESDSPSNDDSGTTDEDSASEEETESETGVENQDSDGTSTPSTENGGELPDTSSPWFNYMLLSVVVAAGAGGALLALRKFAK